jgi:hypothetical protein
MKLSTHYCFVKIPWQILGGPGDSFKTQMKLSTYYSFANSPGGNLAGFGGFLKTQMII